MATGPTSQQLQPLVRQGELPASGRGREIDGGVAAGAAAAQGDDLSQPVLGMKGPRALPKSVGRRRRLLAAGQGRRRGQAGGKGRRRLAGCIVLGRSALRAVRGVGMCFVLCAAIGVFVRFALRAARGRCGRLTLKTKVVRVRFRWAACRSAQSVILRRSEESCPDCDRP